MSDELNTTEALYKPVPQGYRGWSCGTDANGECLCGEPEGVNPSMAACPHAVLVPDVSQTTPEECNRECMKCGHKWFGDENPNCPLCETGLAATIDEWVEREVAAGDGVPDFWDELNTSERLAVYLVQLGWHR